MFQRTLSCLILVVAAITAHSQPAAAQQQGVTIGYVNLQTGQTQLLNAILKKRFVDGGPIQRLAIRSMHDGYNLIRAGKDASGKCRTEALRLTVVGNQLKFVRPTWFFVCSSADCDDSNPDEWIEQGPPVDDGNPFTGDSTGGYLSQGFGICSPNRSKTGCECIGNRSGVTSCNFGIDVSGMEYDSVVIGQ
jgi:hypothetical protein